MSSSPTILAPRPAGARRRRYISCWRCSTRACFTAAAATIDIGLLLTNVPAGWGGVLAKALAPRPGARFAALSELRRALEDALGRGEQARPDEVLPLWRGLTLVVVGLQLCLGLWLGFGG